MLKRKENRASASEVHPLDILCRKKKTPWRCPDDKKGAIDCSSPDILMQHMLGDVKVEEFFNVYWEKKPLHVRRADPKFYGELFTLATIKEVVKANEFNFYMDVHVTAYVTGQRKDFAEEESKITVDTIERLMDQSKATFQFYHPQRYIDELWKMLENMETYFGCLVDAYAYVTPPGCQGSAPHCDDVENFVLQVEGTQEWKLYNPQVELPRDYTQDLLESSLGEPLLTLVLAPGDMLYFPRGFIYQCKAADSSHSTHIALSTYQQNTWGDFICHAVQQAIDSAMEDDVSTRAGLPINYLAFLGSAKNIGAYVTDPDAEKDVNSERKVDSNLGDPRVVEFKDRVQACLEKLADHIDVNKAADAVSADFMGSRLPPYGHESLMFDSGVQIDVTSRLGDKTTIGTEDKYESSSLKKDESTAMEEDGTVLSVVAIETPVDAARTTEAPVSAGEFAAAPVPADVLAPPVHADETTETEAAPVDASETEKVPAEGDKPDAVPVDASKTEAAAVDASKTEAAAVDAGKTEAAVVDAGKTEAAVVDAGKTEAVAVAVDAGKTKSAVVDAGKTGSAVVDAGKTESAVVDAGKTESAVVDAGKTEAAAVDAGKTEAAAVDAGKTEAAAVVADKTDAKPVLAKEAIAAPVPTDEAVSAPMDTAVAPDGDKGKETTDAEITPASTEGLTASESDSDANPVVTAVRTVTAPTYVMPTINDKIKIKYPNHIRIVYSDDDDEQVSDMEDDDIDSVLEDDSMVEDDSIVEDMEQDVVNTGSEEKPAEKSEEKDTLPRESCDDDDDADALVTDTEPHIVVLHSLHNDRFSHMGFGVFGYEGCLRFNVTYAKALVALVNSNDFVAVKDLLMNEDEEKLSLATKLAGEGLLEIRTE